MARKMNLETPFARVPDTNYIPSAEERDTMQSLIREAEEMILELDEEIARLRAEREELQRFVYRHRTLLSPFRRLPADVWRAIFCECLPNNTQLGLCTRTMKEAPLLLTTICRFWRDIALSTPRLWHSIHIFIHLPSGTLTGDGYVAVMQTRMDGYRQWLDRSGSLPITVSLATQGLFLDRLNQDQSSTNALHIARTGFTELVAQYSHRWGTLVFGPIVETLDLSPFDRLTPQDLGLLEDVRGFDALLFHHRGAVVSHPGSTNMSTITHLLSRAPSLRKLKLVSESITEKTLSLSLAWSQLTELSITLASHNILTPGQVIHALTKQYHSLTTFSLEIDQLRHNHNHGTDVHSSSFECQWPTVRDLSISFRCLCFILNPDGSFTLLPVLANTFIAVGFTSLTQFSVCLDDRSYNPNQPIMDAAPFEALLLSSQRSLVLLEVSCPQYFTSEALLRILRPLDALTSLNLGHTTEASRSGAHKGDLPSDRSYRWCSKLLQTMDLENVCPHLEKVGFGRCYVDEVDALLRFVVQRPKLRAFRVDFGQVVGSGWSVESRAEMKVLRERGIELSWSYMEVAKSQHRDNTKDGMPWWSFDLVEEYRRSTGRMFIGQSHELH